jgi:selT/selW/selH-like putative selenoprotein
LAAELRERYPEATIDMIPSGGGRFEVTVDGVPIYQKSKLGRHAKPGEIAHLLAKARGQAADARR